MPRQPDFIDFASTDAQLLEWRSFPLGAVFLLLVPLDRVNEGTALYEAHLIAPRSEPAYRHQRWRFGNPLELIDENVLAVVDLPGVARDWAIVQMDQELLAWYQREPQTRGLPPPAAFGQTNTTLASLWLRAWQPDQLRAIRRKTKSTKLQRYLDWLFQILPIVPLEQPDPGPHGPAAAPGA
jgi:hypothetical protein